MINKTLDIACQNRECGVTFHVLHTSKKGVQAQIIRFSVCPACNTPINEQFRNYWLQFPICKECTYPISWSNYYKGAGGLCGRCYGRNYYKKHVVVASIKE